MAKYKHSEIAAKLAIEGVVAAIDGSVKGQIGIQPRVLGTQEKADLGMSDEGDTLYYPLDDDSGVLLHTDGAHTTIWYGGGDYNDGLKALDKTIRRAHPDAKQVQDEPHATERNLKLRTYDIKLRNNHLAIVDAVYATGKVDNPKFMIRITAMAKENS